MVILVVEVKFVLLKVETRIADAEGSGCENNEADDKQSCQVCGAEGLRFGCFRQGSAGNTRHSGEQEILGDKTFKNGPHLRF